MWTPCQNLTGRSSNLSQAQEALVLYFSTESVVYKMFAGHHLQLFTIYKIQEILTT